MRLSDEVREAMRAALMLSVEQGDPEDEENPDERAARDQLVLAGVAWLDNLDAHLLEAFRAGIQQEQDQHDFDYHGGKIDPSGQDGPTREEVQS